MSDIIEELKRGAEMEEEYDADGIIRIGYKRSLRYRAADEIERLRDQVDAEQQYAAYVIGNLRRVAKMFDEVVEEAQTTFVRTPYGASHEDIVEINEWHKKAKEARKAFEKGSTNVR